MKIGLTSLLAYAEFTTYDTYDMNMDITTLAALEYEHDGTCRYANAAVETLLKETEQKLKESEEYFRILVEEAFQRITSLEKI